MILFHADMLAEIYVVSPGDAPFLGSAGRILPGISLAIAVLIAAMGAIISAA